jgi:hypothetical protein
MPGNPPQHLLELQKELLQAMQEACDIDRDLVVDLLSSGGVLYRRTDYGAKHALHGFVTWTTPACHSPCWHWRFCALRAISKR